MQSLLVILFGTAVWSVFTVSLGLILAAIPVALGGPSDLYYLGVAAGVFAAWQFILYSRSRNGL